MSGRAVEVLAPGKINLILRVLERRPDHFHNLWSVVQAIELSDTIVVQETRGQGIHLSCDGANVPEGPDNLAYRAALRALERSGRRAGIRINLRKHLPVAAGVGGGSSDAAAVIRAMAILLQTGWSVNEMAEIGQEIGSDVPFFFYGPTALVEGRGERVTPFPMEGEGWLVLVNPGIAISTAWAYGKLAEWRMTGEVIHEPLPSLMPSSRSKVKWTDLIPVIQNDFGPVMEAVYPLLRELRLVLLDRGAQAAVLSGSGSTVVAVFPSKEEAQRTADGLERRADWKVWVTRTRTSQWPAIIDNSPAHA